MGTICTPFKDPLDGRMYHLCHMPGKDHRHWIALPAKTCADPGGVWIWGYQYN